MPHQKQSNTFAEYYQRLGYRFINKTHSPYLCMTGDPFSQGHADCRKDLCHRHWDSWHRAGEASRVTVLADKGNPLPCPSPAVQQHQRLAPTGSGFGSKAGNSHPTGGLPLPPAQLPAAVLALCISRAANEFGGLCVIAKEPCSVRQSNHTGHTWSLVLYIQICQTLYHKGHFVLT